MLKQNSYNRVYISLYDVISSGIRTYLVTIIVKNDDKNTPISVTSNTHIDKPALLELASWDIYSMWITKLGFIHGLVVDEHYLCNAAMSASNASSALAM